MGVYVFFGTSMLVAIIKCLQDELIRHVISSLRVLYSIYMILLCSYENEYVLITPHAHARAGVM